VLPLKNEGSWVPICGHMLQLAGAIVKVASDVLRLVVSFLRLSSAIRAENLGDARPATPSA
jgi:hypothetical protein